MVPVRTSVQLGGNPTVERVSFGPIRTGAVRLFSTPARTKCPNSRHPRLVPKPIVARNFSIGRDGREQLKKKMRWIISVDLMTLVVYAGVTAGFSLKASLLHFVGFPAAAATARGGGEVVSTSSSISAAMSDSTAPPPRRPRFWFRRRQQPQLPPIPPPPQRRQQIRRQFASSCSSSLDDENFFDDKEDDDAKRVPQAPSSPPQQPVHLLQQQPEPNDDDDEPEKKKTTATTTTMLQVHTYQDTTNLQTYKGLNTSRRKFQAYLHYVRQAPVDAALISTTTMESSSAPSGDATGAAVVADVISPEDRQLYKRLWDSGRLVTDRTEWLSASSSGSSSSSSSAAGGGVKTSSSVKFPELLQLYTDRVWGFRQDAEASNEALRDWLQSSSSSSNSHGNNDNNDWQTLLTATHMRTLSIDRQKAGWKRFLEWFRSEYPYYYDRCEHCGASKREDMQRNPKQKKKKNENGEDALSEQEQDDDDDEKQQTFIGYIHANATEATFGKAMRTELYQCHVCHGFTRFPRYNSVRHVLDHRRGRCGEYAMLLYRTLQYLGHDARWVVDWADHVWAEVFLDGQWVHLDPCEAAVDEPLLYQQWGKRQVYIVAFYLPPRSPQSSTAAATATPQSSVLSSSLSPLPYINHQHQPTIIQHALVEDVTHQYTTESWDTICGWRDETEAQVQSAIGNATKTLEQRLGITINNATAASSPSREKNTTETQQTVAAAVR
jgi:Transglutaminase-like superfamily